MLQIYYGYSNLAWCFNLHLLTKVVLKSYDMSSEQVVYNCTGGHSMCISTVVHVSVTVIICTMTVNLIWFQSPGLQPAQ